MRYVPGVHRSVYALVLLCSVSAYARDDGRYSNSDSARREWFTRQTINERARQRLKLPYKSCCDNGDVFKTHFRVGGDGEDVWEYLDSDNVWKVIPSDIIHDDPAIDREPILFKAVGSGVPICFFKPNGGI
jgi:hypothetical protein